MLGSSIPHSSPKREPYDPHFAEEETGSERLSYLPKITQLVSGGTGTWTHIYHGHGSCEPFHPMVGLSVSYKCIACQCWMHRWHTLSWMLSKTQGISLLKWAQCWAFSVEGAAGTLQGKQVGLLQGLGWWAPVWGHLVEPCLGTSPGPGSSVTLPPQIGHNPSTALATWHPESLHRDPPYSMDLCKPPRWFCRCLQPGSDSRGGHTSSSSG